MGKQFFTVVLDNRGNPDFGQDPNRRLPDTCRRVVRCKSLEEAATQCQDYITYYQLGGGNWTGGSVRQGNKKVARISYNGRVWPEVQETGE
jgi:hypothetical protein